MTKNKIKSLIIAAAILFVVALAGCVIAQAVISKNQRSALAQVSENVNDMQVSGSNNEVATALTLAAPRSMAKTTAATVASDIETLSDDKLTTLGVELSDYEISQLDGFFGAGYYEVYNFSHITVGNNLNSTSRSDVLFIRNKIGGTLPMQLYFAFIPKANVFTELGICSVTKVVLTENGTEKEPWSMYPEKLPYNNYYIYALQTLSGSKPLAVTYSLVQIAKPVPLPADPVKEGHTFVGWYYDSAFTRPYDGGTIYDDTQLYAKFEVNRYSIFLYTESNRFTTQTVEWNTVPTLPTPTKSDYSFDGWYMEDGTKYANQPIKSNITLTAHWYRSTFMIYFDPDGGVLASGKNVEFQKVNLNESVSLSTLYKTGYNFMGWYYEDGTQYTNQPVTDDMTLYAHWEIKRYTVSFYVDGNLYTTLEVEHGAKLVDIASEQNLVVMSVFSDSPSFSATALEARGVTTDLNVTATEKKGMDKVANTVKNNKWQIIGGVVGGVVLISVLAAAASFIKRKNAKGYDYEDFS